LSLLGFSFYIASSVLFIVSLVFLLHKSIRTKSPVLLRVMGVWQGVGMDSLKFHSDLPCPTLLRPAGRQPLKRLYSHFRGGLPTGWEACSHLLPIWTPAALYLCFQSFFQSTALPSRRVFDWVLRGHSPSEFSKVSLGPAEAPPYSMPCG
jgi:hypothetical protein